MSTDQLNKLNESLELLLSKERMLAVKPALEKLGKDLWLIDRLQKLSSDQSPSNVTQIIDILEYVVLKEYNMDDPTVLGQFYRSAIGKGRRSMINDYGAIAEHTQQLAEKEPALMAFGLKEANVAESVNQHNKGYEYYSPYSYGENSYGAMIQSMQDDGSRKMPLNEALNAFKDHFENLMEKDIDIMKLIGQGYLKTLSKVYSRHHEKQNAEAIGTELGKLSNTLEHLDAKGFNVYRSQTINALDNYAANNQIEELERMVDSCHRNYIILKLGIMLKE